MNWSRIYDPRGRQVLSTVVMPAALTGFLSPPGRAFAHAGRTHPCFGTLRAWLGAAQARVHAFTSLVAR